MMRLVLLASLACLAVAAPSGYYGGHQLHGYEAHVNRANAQRQLYVNHVAEHVGSGTGTAHRDGVPGTVLGVTGYSHGHGYGHGGFAHGGYGNRGHGGYAYGGY